MVTEKGRSQGVDLPEDTAGGGGGGGGGGNGGGGELRPAVADAAAAACEVGRVGEECDSPAEEFTGGG
ncbi:TPA: hypothetical protein ACH3X2_002352 [Trebouxia sp. C0005]